MRTDQQLFSDRYTE